MFVTQGRILHTRCSHLKKRRLSASDVIEEGNWVDDGSEISYHPWAPAFDPSGTHRNCAIMKSNTGQWVPKPCKEKHFVFFEDAETALCKDRASYECICASKWKYGLSFSFWYKYIICPIFQSKWKYLKVAEHFKG